jgi:hypothetical protein
MRMFFTAVAVCVALASCGGQEPAPVAEQAEAKKALPPDEPRSFPREGRTKMELVEDNLLGKDYLPGGNLAEYERDGKIYQLFLAVLPDRQAAQFLAMDVKDQLDGAKLVPHFGGYFGMDGDTPWFVFAKNDRVAGVVGLPEDEADAVARDFASRIP